MLALLGWIGAGGGGDHRQINDEAGSLPRHGLGMDMPAHALYQAAADGQAKSGATSGTLIRAIGLGKRLEQARQKVRRNAAALVADPDGDVLACTDDIDIYAAARRGELDRVGKEVLEHLDQPVPVHPHTQRTILHPAAPGQSLVVEQRLRKPACPLQQGQQGLITQMDVWNDSAEWLLVRAGLATL
ncbi:MAG: hypothetical protein VW625_06865 [Perlucidibaca sp.]